MNLGITKNIKKGKILGEGYFIYLYIYIYIYIFFFLGGVQPKKLPLQGGPCEKNWQAEGGSCNF